MNVFQCKYLKMSFNEVDDDFVRAIDSIEERIKQNPNLDMEYIKYRVLKLRETINSMGVYFESMYPEIFNPKPVDETKNDESMLESINDTSDSSSKKRKLNSLANSAEASNVNDPEKSILMISKKGEIYEDFLMISNKKRITTGKKEVVILDDAGDDEGDDEVKEKKEDIVKEKKDSNHKDEDDASDEENVDDESDSDYSDGSYDENSRKIKKSVSFENYKKKIKKYQDAAERNMFEIIHKQTRFCKIPFIMIKTKIYDLLPRHLPCAYPTCQDDGFRRFSIVNQSQDSSDIEDRRRIVYTCKKHFKMFPTTIPVLKKRYSLCISRHCGQARAYNMVYCEAHNK